MKNFKYQIGNVVECTNNGKTIKGVVVWASYNLCTFEQQYSVESDDKWEHMGIKEDDMKLIKSGNNLSDDQQQNFNIRKALESLGC